MKLPVRPLLALFGAILVALAAGCGTSGTLSPNLAPETLVFVSGPLDTVNHVVRLRWFGTDPDGEVTRYEFKWIYEPGQAPAGYDSNAWTPTTRTDSTFRAFTPNGTSMPTFVVRAIDNEATPDPSPARQTFSFRNDPPNVSFTGAPVLPANTLPVATVTWQADDPDGNIGLAHYLIWIDDNESSATIVPASNSYTLPPSLFSDGAGGYVAGPHTVFIRAVDDGGAMSAPDSFTWNVIAPVGDVLLIDDVPAAQSAPVDPMYINAFDNQIGSGQYTRVDVEGANPFRSANDLTYTFAFFEAVFWYQDNSTVRSGLLALAETAIRTHLAAGRDLYIASVTLVGTNGAIPSQDFLEEIVGADSVRTNAKLMTSNFSIGNFEVILPGPEVPYDPLSAVAIATNVDALALKSADEAAFLAPPIVLDSTQVEDWIVGVDRVPAGGTGRLVFLSFPLRLLGGTPPSAPPITAPDANYGEKTVRRILARFGHGVPL